MSGKEAAQPGLNWRLTFAIGAAAIGSAFQHGYNTGVVNAPQEMIQKWIRDIKVNRSLSAGGTEEVDPSSVTLIWSLAVAMFCVGGMLGGCSVGYVADQLGRKYGLLYNNVLVVVAVLLEGCSKSVDSYEMLILGRFVIGLNSGLNAGLAPMYLSEVAPVSLRGAVGTVYQLVITISILISQILGLESVLGSEELWPYLLGVTLIPAILQLATLPLCPETPKHILDTTGNEIKAKQSLTWFRGDTPIQSEMEQMKLENESAKLGSKVNFRELVMNPSLRIPLIISSMLMVAQQFSGINAAIYFSTGIFRLAQLSEKNAQLATLMMGTVNVCMTVVSLFLVERAGRKTLLLVGFSGMFVSTIILTICLENADVVAVAYLSIFFVILFVVFFSIGPGSIPWFMVTELFSQNARPAASSVAVAVNWTANFFVGLGFLPLQTLMGSYVFLIFAALQACFVLFIYKKVPETKNKTTEEISALFRQISYQ